MTVMVIVAILTSIAIPSYRNYMIRTNRSEAKTALVQYSAQFERCFTNVNSYTDGCAMAFPLDLPSGTYRINTSERETETFTLTATPLGPQAEDEQCGTLTLKSTGERGSGGSLKTPQCWAR